MRKILLIFALTLFFSFTSAQGVGICIDLEKPSAPSNLSVSGSVGSILLEWEAASDEPNCSGIGKYIVSRNGSKIGEVGGDVLSFVDVDSLVAGWYNYTVYAVDMVGHNTGAAVKNEVVLVKPNDGGTIHVSGGGGGSSYRCYEDWVCEDWSECVGGYVDRACVDLNECGPENDKPEVRMVCGGEEIRVGGYGSGGSVKDDSSGDVGFVSRVTGAVVGVVGSTGGIVVGVFVLIVLGGFVAIKIRNKK